MKLSAILQHLREQNIDFSILNSNDDLSVFPANFKKIISNGLYHITHGVDFDFKKIKDSVIVTDKAFETDNTLIIVDHPQLVHYRLTNLFEKTSPRSIHPTAIIDPEAEIGENVNIGPYSIIGKCIIKDHVYIASHVVIHDKVFIDSHSYIDSQSVIGPEGLAWVWDKEGNRVKQSQLGGVIIEKNCHLATDITIVRGSLAEDTIVGEGTVIAHGSKIGHGTKIGKHVHMANNVSIAGNTTLGDRSFYGSGCVIPPNIKIGANNIVGAGAVVNKSFEKEYLTLVGVPAKVLRENSHLVKAKGTPTPFKK